MTDDEFLKALLDSQALKEDDPELVALRAKRDEVETLLREKLGAAKPTIRYSGSYMKKTLNKDSYDLDLTCYVPNGNTAAGETLEQIHESVRKVLAANYAIEVKTSALRLKSSDGTDFHVDVVPGRYVDDSKTDVFLHQTTGDKMRLKTNLDVHLSHIRDSGVTEAIRLAKLWRNRNGLNNAPFAFKTFVLELAAVDLLKGKKSEGLSAQLKHVLTELRDSVDDIKVVDPANANNDLSEAFDTTVRAQVKQVAKTSLEAYERSGWEGVFGPLPVDKEKRAESIQRVVKDTQPARPWHRG